MTYHLFDASDKSARPVAADKKFIITDSSRLSDGFAPDRPFIFDGILMCICLTGSASFRINHREVSLTEGEILTIVPNHILRCIGTTEDFFCEILYFSVDFTAEFPFPMSYEIFFRIGEKPTVAVEEKVLRSIRDIHALIVKQQDSASVYRERIVKTLLFAMLLEVGSVYMARESQRENAYTKNRGEELTESFFILLMEHHRTHRSVAFYAAEMCLTPKYLSTVIKNTTGRGALDWINEAVVIDIKTRLRTSNCTILQLSEEFNFANPSFFGRFFRQNTGMTPMQYRNGL